MTIRPRTPEDDQQILDIYNRIHFDTPPLTLEVFRRWISSRPEGAKLEQWVVEEDGRVVGVLDLEERWETAQPGAWEILLEVDPAWQRRGIGNRMYAHLTERQRALGTQRLYCRIREDRPESLVFAEKRGFRPTGRVERESRLKVDEARLDGFEDVESQLHQAGIIISTLAEIGMENEPFLRALHHMSEGTIQDVPHTEAFQPRPFEFWVQRTLLFPGNSPEWCWVAVHGDCPVGLARLRRQENAAFNAYTAVDQAYRGRGIARALKLRTVLWARHNGVDFIYTGNDLENRRMLDINIRLGYQPLPGSVEVLKEVS